VRFQWDPAKDALNRRKHGIGFDEAAAVFAPGSRWLDMDDEAHSQDEIRYRAIGAIARGVVLVVYTGRRRREDHQRAQSVGAREASLRRLDQGAPMSDDIPELTEADFARAIPGALRRRLMRGVVRGGKDVAALRRFVGMTQEEFARAAGISVDTLQNWEQGRRRPQGTAVALIRIVARDPRVLRRNLAAAAAP